jgi:hydrogenase-4 component B
MTVDLVIVAIALAAISGIPGLFLSRMSRWGQRLAAVIMVGAALAGLAGACSALRTGPLEVAWFPWPAAGNSLIGVDALSAFFLFPVFLMGGLGPVYGLGYWAQRRHPGNGRRLQLFWGFMVAGMALLMISRHAMAFLLGWEVMTLAAFFLVSTEDDRAECRRASWVYLIATHVGTLTLFALLVLWRRATGSYALVPVAPDLVSLSVMNGLFFLALVSFGLKAGMMPFHFWLPGAHANAPSHVSALLSGVLLKTGIYGLVRFLSLLPDPPGAWGGVIILLGAVSALFGVVFAIGQHDLKRLLAYHSIENIGIILMGVGIAMLGRSAHRPEWVVLGLAGALLHVWNHALFKSLLFMSAGSVVHNTHTGQIDRLGGLSRSMPTTAAMFLVGAVAICGLPPLNGFVSEFFTYLGLLHTATSTAGRSAAVLAAPVLAMTGALALACFIKVYGVVFLGVPRTPAAARAHESPLTMRAPMGILVACCALIGLLPVLTGPVLDRAIAGWSRELDSVPRLGTIAPLTAMSWLSAALTAGIALVAAVLTLRTRVLRRTATWGCGYAVPTSRMQYTASSFAQTIVLMFGHVLRPRVHQPQIRGLRPGPVNLHTHVEDAVLDRWLVPFGHRVERWFSWFHRFQQGLTQYYILYILIAVILMLGTLIPFSEVVRRLFAQ